MLNDKPVILLDCDDVLARCSTKMCEMATRLTGKKWVEEEISDYDFFALVAEAHPEQPTLKQALYADMASQGWALGIEPFEGALEGVRSLQEFAEVFVLTSPFSGEYWEYERRRWLYDHFKILSSHVLQGKAKFLVHAEVFVDDKPENIDEWSHYQAHNSYDLGLAVLWDRPHNKSAVFDTSTGEAIVRVATWPELEEAIHSHLGGSVVPTDHE